MPDGADLLGVLWSVEVPGDRSHVVVVDGPERAMFVSDGWGVAYAALRLRRLSLDDGHETASVRTRHQPVGALALAGGRLWVATDRRLLAVDPRSLDVLDQWDKGLVRYTQTLVPVPRDERLVMANWMAPTVGVFDPVDGSTRRVRVGPQPLVVADGSRVRLIAGFDGGIATLDPEGRATGRRPTPPVAGAVALGDGALWAVRAGQHDGRGKDRGGKDSGKSDPPTWARAVTDELVRLDREAANIKLPARCEALAADPVDNLLWCILRAAPESPDDGGLAVVDPARGHVVARHQLPSSSALVHLDPSAGLAFGLRPADPPVPDGHRHATLTAYLLP